jgi:hypothetical protein
MESFGIETIQPAPSRSTTTTTGLLLQFDVDANDGVAPVVLQVRPTSIGTARYEIAIDGTSAGVLRTLILP